MVTYEHKRLAGVDTAIRKLVGKSDFSAELRMQVLEATAAVLGGFDIDAFQRLFDVTPIESAQKLQRYARNIVPYIHRTGIHPALCLSALARETLDSNSQRTNGVYHTDFRLAERVANEIVDKLRPGTKVVDPACGAGILLTAVSILACQRDRIPVSDWFRCSLYAADISPIALRGTLLALASLTDDLDSLRVMRQHWKDQNSLLAPSDVWDAMAADGFDVVVANPPWEKLKLTRHEYAKVKRNDRLYGSRVTHDSLTGFETARNQKASHAAELVARYPSLRGGEPDLYIAFTELILRLTRNGGQGVFIVPGGLIRSKNTESIRRMIIESSRELDFTVMSNSAKHFSIDTRFKFLVVKYTKARRKDQKLRQIRLTHAEASENEIRATNLVPLSLDVISDLRPNLTLPEVRTDSEWKLFQRMQSKTITTDSNDVPWQPDFCREVDMTRARPNFRKSPKRGYIPLIEGRMVQPHRLGCKEYVSGAGRGAKWLHRAPGLSAIRPQFWVPAHALSPVVQNRVSRTRVGFCDITGQTNERSMMAAIVPPGFACGNKVPTVEFPNDNTGEYLLLWLAIVNSFPFDWLIRRVLTTTVNYFVLSSIRLPNIDIKSKSAQYLIRATRMLMHLDNRGRSTISQFWRIANLRALLDVLVADAYGCDEDDLWLIMDDFPLLDRGQRTNDDKTKSTITIDLLISTWRRLKKYDGNEVLSRIEESKNSGEIPYLSSEFAECAQRCIRMSESDG